MNNQFNDQFEENIRPPDEVRRERLVEDNRDQFQKDLAQALLLSMEEMKKQQETYIDYEKKIMEDFIGETNNRKQIFCNFIINLNKLIRFDKEVKEIYEIIEPIIDAYCGQAFETCSLDIETYNKIFNLLKKIRTDQNAVDRLKNIIIIE
jgi:hypothetical protein